MMMTKNLKISPGAVALSSLFFVTTIAAEAAAYNPSPNDYSRQDPVVGASRKLGRGLANTGLGWMEIFKGMRDVGRENGFLAGAAWGPLYGAVNAVRRTATGVYETATFPFQGPNRYDAILEPEFVLTDQN